MKKRIFSRVLALFMAVSLLSTTAFAASFADLQDAIGVDLTPPTDNVSSGSHTNGTWISEDNGGTYGFGWNDQTQIWGIHAWDQDGTRNVLLNENVTYDSFKDTDNKSITVSNGATVSIDMGGSTIDGGYRAADPETGAEEQKGNGTSVIKVENSTLTLSNGTITGGGGSGAGDGGGINSWNSTLAAKDVDIAGNKGWHGGGIFIEKGSYTMTGGSISGNEAYGNGGGIYTKDKDGQMSVNMENVIVSGNNGGAYGGGIRTWGTDMTLTNVTVTDNYAQKFGGGIVISSSSHLTMNGGSIAGNSNTSNANYGGGGLFIDRRNDTAELSNVLISGNTAAGIGGGIYINQNEAGYQNSLILREGNEIHGNFAQGAGATIGSDLYAPAGTIVAGLGTPSKAPEGQQFDGWYENGSNGQSEEQYGVPNANRITENVNLVAGLSEAPTVPGMPDVPGDAILPGTDFTGGADAGTSIEDEEVPLAGLFTRADAIGYLWEQTGSPEAELSDFPDVPEDHYWATAIGWAQDMGIALPDEEGNFRPDDLVLRTSDEPEGELQEFLNRYAVFAGVELDEGELFIELDGEVDDIIMGEDAQVIFDEFFAKLEATLEDKAA